jgi:carbamoyl-phosphate synthase small subunit
VLPSTASLEEVLAVAPDGLFFSNGPGDPAATTAQIELLRGALERGLPYFGICFGNQLFGRALGFGTYKLKYGHRGINQPVMDRTTGKVEVTAHNHGFAVDAPLDTPTETPYGTVTVSHVCLNDDVVEGLELRDSSGALKSFSVQYHPEAAAGPHDAAYLFDRFTDLMRSHTGGGSADPAGATPQAETPSGPPGGAWMGLAPRSEERAEEWLRPPERPDGGAAGGVASTSDDPGAPTSSTDVHGEDA